MIDVIVHVAKNIFFVSSHLNLIAIIERRGSEPRRRKEKPSHLASE